MKSVVERNYYASCHQKLIRRYGNAVMCESINCKSISPKRFEWALKNGCEYTDNVNDYIQLCPSCHRKYDYNKEQGYRHSVFMKGRSPTKKQLSSLNLGRKLSAKSVLQFTLNGEFIKEWLSISIAAKKLNILNSSISNCIKQKSKTSGGYIWKIKKQAV